MDWIDLFLDKENKIRVRHDGYGPIWSATYDPSPAKMDLCANETTKPCMA